LAKLQLNKILVEAPLLHEDILLKSATPMKLNRNSEVRFKKYIKTAEGGI
jgi:hypothetical protein